MDRLSSFSCPFLESCYGERFYLNEGLRTFDEEP